MLLKLTKPRPDCTVIFTDVFRLLKLLYSVLNCKNKLKMLNYTSGFKPLEKIVHQLLNNRIIIYLCKILIGGKAEEACS